MNPTARRAYFSHNQSCWTINLTKIFTAINDLHAHSHFCQPDILTNKVIEFAKLLFELLLRSNTVRQTETTDMDMLADFEAISITICNPTNFTVDIYAAKNLRWPYIYPEAIEAFTFDANTFRALIYAQHIVGMDDRRKMIIWSKLRLTDFVQVTNITSSIDIITQVARRDSIKMLLFYIKYLNADDKLVNHDTHALSGVYSILAERFALRPDRNGNQLSRADVLFVYSNLIDGGFEAIDALCQIIYSAKAELVWVLIEDFLDVYQRVNRKAFTCVDNNCLYHFIILTHCRTLEQLPIAFRIMRCLYVKKFVPNWKICHVILFSHSKCAAKHRTLILIEVLRELIRYCPKLKMIVEIYSMILGLIQTYKAELIIKYGIIDRLKTFIYRNLPQEIQQCAPTDHKAKYINAIGKRIFEYITDEQLNSNLQSVLKVAHTVCINVCN